MDINILRSRFLLKGIRQSQIAEELSVSRQMIDFVVRGKSKSIRIRKYISKRLGFPEYEWEIFDKIINE